MPPPERVRPRARAPSCHIGGNGGAAIDRRGGTCHPGGADAAAVRGADEARLLIDQEHVSPAGAAVGAYYLLRTGEAAACLGWYRELTQNFPAFPDFWVALGTASLQAERPAGECAHAFLRAAEAGVPCFREGLELLRDGIDMLRADDDPQVLVAALRDAALRYAPLLRALEPESPVTTWRCGETPDPPGVRRTSQESG